MEGSKNCNKDWSAHCGFAKGRSLRMIIWRRPTPPDDYLREAGPTGWSFPRCWPLCRLSMFVVVCSYLLLFVVCLCLSFVTCCWSLFFVCFCYCFRLLFFGCCFLFVVVCRLSLIVIFVACCLSLVVVCHLLLVFVHRLSLFAVCHCLSFVDIRPWQW